MKINTKKLNIAIRETLSVLTIVSICLGITFFLLAVSTLAVSNPITFIGLLFAFVFFGLLATSYFSISDEEVEKEDL